MNNNRKKIVMMGATGAVGGEALKQLLLRKDEVEKIDLLSRKTIPNLPTSLVSQHEINIFDTVSYNSIITDHNVAICTLGVGEPTKIDREMFIKIDKTAVLAFAKVCKAAGIKHFELLASVGADIQSKFWYLKIKGELIEALRQLEFDRLSIFMPSMIITPTNRYGFSQWLTLKLWPIISPLFLGGLKKYRGIKVETLGQAMANNVFKDKVGYETLSWQEFMDLAGSPDLGT